MIYFCEPIDEMRVIKISEQDGTGLNWQSTLSDAVSETPCRQPLTGQHRPNILRKVESGLRHAAHLRVVDRRVGERRGRRRRRETEEKKELEAWCNGAALALALV